ncbi:MAG: radical SAM protein [Candidatus Saganbacteria bacterium]|uniref:Radical SAM protein n=1 Tax=Candidatus Saganbacteria bacterium TaxID=2575572 RepID=A0A833L0B2_UNCSA|nr:MAG: radical SAM protein [Candidatus Saganbacteria bacterium]
MQNISYKIDNSLYLNITNRCTNACVFCIRNKNRDFNGKYHLWLDYEPATEEIMKEIGDSSKYKEIIFCGYGEPLIRLSTVIEVAKEIKKKDPKTKIRVDTNGHANLFYQRNVLPELKDLIDVMSISLNAQNSEVYNSICNSFFGSAAFDAVIDFIKEAKKYIPEVEATVVGIPNAINLEKAKSIVEGLGVKYRVRTYYEDEYVK